MGPNTDPSGTPNCNIFSEEYESSIFICCVLFRRNDPNHENDIPWIPISSYKIFNSLF